jgi:hypothetical protein
MYESRKEGVKEARTKEENQGNSQRQSLSDKVRLFKKKFEEQIQHNADFGKANKLSLSSRIPVQLVSSKYHSFPFSYQFLVCYRYLYSANGNQAYIPSRIGIY